MFLFSESCMKILAVIGLKGKPITFSVELINSYINWILILNKLNWEMAEAAEYPGVQ